MLSTLQRPYCLCVCQPWAEWIASGLKTIEVRSRRTNYRGPLLIAATKRPQCGSLPAGAIVCQVDVVDCRPWSDEDVAAALCGPGHGEWSWILANPQRLKPIPIRGQQGIFRVDILKSILSKSDPPREPVEENQRLATVGSSNRKDRP